MIPQIQATLGPLLRGGFAELATAMGVLFRDLGMFFASPTFKEFVQRLFPATIEFLRFFGPNFIKFLDGLVKLSSRILPFLNTLGRMLGGTLFQLGDFFDRLSRSSTFQAWLDSMTKTLDLVLELVGTVIEFFAVLFAQLDAAGGKDVIQSLVDAIGLLAFLLSTDVGQKALEGLIHLAILSIQVFTGLLLAILLVSATLEAFGEWVVHTAIPAIGGALEWLGGKAVTVGKFFVDLWHSVTGAFSNVETAVRSLPGRILAAIGNLGSLLINAGRNLIDGFIEGIKSRAQALISVVSNLIHQAMSFFPGSPAEKGPLSGEGYSLNRGQRMMEDFAKGIRMEIPTIQAASSEATSNIIFGPNSIRVGFEGALPTQEQAMQTGSAVGAGINGQLAARNTRLAVRTL